MGGGGGEEEGGGLGLGEGPLRQGPPQAAEGEKETSCVSDKLISCTSISL